MRIISSLVINLQFRRIDHNGSHKPVFVLSPGTPEKGAMAGELHPLPFQNGATGAEVPFHNSIIGNFMVYKVDLK